MLTDLLWHTKKVTTSKVFEIMFHVFICNFTMVNYHGDIASGKWSATILNAIKANGYQKSKHGKSYEYCPPVSVFKVLGHCYCAQPF